MIYYRMVITQFSTFDLSRWNGLVWKEIFWSFGCKAFDEVGDIRVNYSIWYDEIFQVIKMKSSPFGINPFLLVVPKSSLDLEVYPCSFHKINSCSN